MSKLYNKKQIDSDQITDTNKENKENCDTIPNKDYYGKASLENAIKAKKILGRI